MERTGKIYPSPCPHHCPDNSSEGCDRLRTPRDYGMFSFSKHLWIYYGQHGDIKRGIQRPTSQGSKVLAVRKKLTCSSVKCTLMDTDSVATEAQSI